MPVQLSHPDGLLQQSDYAPVAVGTGSRLVLLAGQVAVTAAGDVTSTDLAGQVHSALQNVATGVRGAGGDVSDIARLTVYVVDWTPEMAARLMDGIARAQESDGYSTPMPPLTLIGVQGLWSPGLLVEIEAAAVLA
ncbi:RidA family protein [Agromyces humatus]|uniref:RidA family protein n=1 Tax=Agromyces humatus TaxID=279573 RepID=A0ABN2KMG7_9MICO|nr:RidA family protein [Agromyces humatus]